MDLFDKFISLKYFSNVIETFNFLRVEFIKITINPLQILYFIKNVFFVLLLFIVFYYIGDSISSLFKFKTKKYLVFVNILFGYIIIGVTIAIIGSINRLYFSYVFPLLLLSFIFSLFRFYRLKHYSILYNFTKNFKVKKGIFSWIVIFIVFLSFIRLLLPEINEDGYHTDLATLYYSSHTTNHEARDPLMTIPYAQLPEMIYILPIAFADKETSRIIHFCFYILIILLLYKYAKYNNYAKFAPLIFATTPLVMRYSSSQYTDFFMVYPFLLAVILLSLRGVKEILIAGACFGAVLSAKQWTIVYFPIFIIYVWIISGKNNKQDRLKNVLIFTLGTFLVSSIWQIRSILLTGSPFFPFLAKTYYIGRDTEVSKSFDSLFRFALKINLFFLVENARLIGPIILASFGLVLIWIFKLKKLMLTNKVLPFFILLTLVHVLINFYGRYLLPWIVISAIFLSYGLHISYKKIHITKYFILTFTFIFIFYYFLSTLLLLPYGFEWANKNKYLTRTLDRDNVSYYDYDNRFDKLIDKNDLVATYQLANFYYANFKHIDINFIFNENALEFDELKKYGVTKLLIKDGDINWFCNELPIKSCSSQKVKYLSSYTNIHKYYLYKME